MRLDAPSQTSSSDQHRQQRTPAETQVSVLPGVSTTVAIMLVDVETAGAAYIVLHIKQKKKSPRRQWTKKFLEEGKEINIQTVKPNKQRDNKHTDIF